MKQKEIYSSGSGLRYDMQIINLCLRTAQCLLNDFVHNCRMLYIMFNIDIRNGPYFTVGPGQKPGSKLGSWNVQGGGGS